MTNAPKAHRASTVFAIFATILCLLILIPGIKLAVFAFNPTQPGSTQSTFIEINKGQNSNDLAKLLASTGIISNGNSFLWLGRITRQWKRIKAGEYKVSPAMTPMELFSVITSGISAAHPITVREGENMYEVADDLQIKKLSNRVRFLNLCKDAKFISSFEQFKSSPPKSLEGYLFPDTYFFNRKMSEGDMIKQMVRRFFTHWTAQQEERARNLNLSRHEVVTLASIIEKETGAPEERPIISAVFHNRLKKRMKLQSDPTTIYGMWERYQGKIHRSDLLEKNDYNTYSVSALPVGPIGNPGSEAIQAALFPDESATYYYFVSHNDGTHQFSRTIAEHNEAVRKFQLDPKAREGKSWRDRLKKLPGNLSSSPAQGNSAK
jgi:UPF0755 protein